MWSIVFKSYPWAHCFTRPCKKTQPSQKISCHNSVATGGIKYPKNKRDSTTRRISKAALGLLYMGERGLEPPRIATLDPKFDVFCILGLSVLALSGQEPHYCSILGLIVKTGWYRIG